VRDYRLGREREAAEVALPHALDLPGLEATMARGKPDRANDATVSPMTNGVLVNV
jgi:hypothetical protein